MIMEQKKKFIKPAQFAEHEIIKAIVTGEWAADQKILPERELAELLGITRPTLREVLQRLSRDGWLTIKHGRPTVVVDYKKNGGLAVLKSLLNYEEFTSKSLIRDWLEFRILILPDLAHKASMLSPDEILKKLDHAPILSDESSVFSVFDWDLQILLIKHSRNTIAQMFYNDLSELYHKEGEIYFSNVEIKKKSLDYYERLKEAIRKNEIKNIVKQTMQESLEMWEKMNQ